MKKIKRANIIIIVLILIFALTVSLINIFKGDTTTSLKALIIIPIVFIPTILRKLFKIKFRYILETIIILFIFFSYYLGYVFNIYHELVGYDKIIHGVSGLVTCFFALFILKQSKKYREEDKWFNILFCIYFSMTIAILWEFLEFADDKFLGKDEQSVKTTGVDDTMYDLLVALIGSIVFCMCYYFEVIFHKDLFIKKYLKYIN